MKTLIAATSVLVMIGAATTAHAGCSNYEDGSLPNTAAPRFEVCYDAVCDITTVLYQCANQNSYQDGYAIGWSRECQIISPDEQTCVIKWQNRPIDPAKHDRLTFTPLDAE